MKIIEIEEPDDNNYEETGRTIYLANTVYVKIKTDNGLKCTIAVPFTLIENYNGSTDECESPTIEITALIEESELSDEDAKRPELDDWEKLMDFDMLKKEVEKTIKEIG